MSVAVPAPSPTPLLVQDGAQKVEVTGTAAAMIRMIVQQAAFYNAPYNAGVIHFHFSGKEQRANCQADLNCLPQGA